MTEQATPVPLVDNQLIAERRAKLAEIRQQGIAFPNDFKREHLAADLHAKYGEMEAEALEAAAVTVSVAGRMMLKRVMGKASFATVQDIAEAVLYLADAKQVTGEVLHVDGGAHAGRW